MKTQTTVGAVALASIIALAGCSTGGSDKSGTTSGSSAPTTSAPMESQTATSTAQASPSAGAPSVDPEAVDGEQGALRIDSATNTVDGTPLAKSISKLWAERGGPKLDSATCPDLSATVGASVTCKLVSGADTLMLTVVVTAVNGSSLEYEVKSGE